MQDEGFGDDGATLKNRLSARGKKNPDMSINKKGSLAIFKPTVHPQRPTESVVGWLSVPSLGVILEEMEDAT